MKAKQPYWPLDRVKRLAAEGKMFLQKTRALDFFGSPAEAYAAATSTVAILTVRNYAERKDQTYDICDVYGVAREGGGWMLKIYIDETVPGTELTIISFHPLRHPLRTNGGLVKP